MALKGNWTDKVDGVDYVLSQDINDIAHSVIEVEEAIEDISSGQDGVTFTPDVSSEGTISWTNDGGLQNPTPVNIKGPQGIPGVQGPQGETGAAGTSVTIKSIVESDESGGENVVTFSTGETLTVRNGGDADPSGYTLGLHADGLLYIFYNGQPIGNGVALPSGGDVVGNVDSENNIVVTGALPDGTYTVKYMMDDGSTVDIGTLQLSSGPAYTNLLEDAGYQTDTRINSGGVESAYTGLCVSGFIPFTPSDTYMLLKNISVASPPSNLYLCFYDSNKNPVFGAGSTKTGVLINSVFSTTRSDGTIEISQTTLASGASHDGLTLPTDYAYVRFNAVVIDDTSIVTVDEEIV